MALGSDADDPGSGLRFALLGPVRMLAGGEPVPLGSPGARGLLLLLLLNANQVVSIDRIIAGLWGDDPPATARTIVHGYVSRLRRLLREADPAGTVARIDTRSPGYLLSVDEARVDVFQARRLLAAARGQPAARRSELLRSAAGLWRGPLPVNPPTEAVTVEVNELRQVILGERIEADLELGRHAELVGELRHLVRDHPFDEGLVGQLIRALYGAGQRADALEQYHQFQRRVADELGIDPGPQLRELHELLLRDDPVLRAANQPRQPERPRRVVPAQLPLSAGVFAGREAELAWLDRLLAGRDGGAAARIAVITGPAGIGKSALAVTWGRRVAAEFPDGVLFAALRGFDPAGPPLAAVEALSRFLLALGVRAEEIPEDPDEQAALYRSLLAERRVLVVLDDARDSEHVRPLLPGGGGSLVVVTSRRRLDGLVARSGARLLPLNILPADRATALIEEAAADAGVAITHDQAAELARLADCLPLALRVIAARLAVAPGREVERLVAELRDERTRLTALDLENADTSVRAALDVSYRALHPAIGSAFRMLGLAPANTVDPHVLAALCGTTVEGADRRLRSLAEANLVAEAGARRFVMHDLVRLHARGLAETELSGSAADDALGRLLAYYRATCDHARRLLHPPRDDLDFAGRYPAAGRPELTTPEQGAEWFGAEWQNLSALLRSAVAAGRHLEAWQLVLLSSYYLTTSTSYHDWSTWARTGLASARAIGDAEGEVQMLIMLSSARSRYGHGAEALDDAQLALRIATRLGDSRHIRIALGSVGSGLYGQGRYREALLCDQESYRLSAEAGDWTAQAHALNNMSQVERALGRPEEAAEHVRAAIELWARIGDTGHELLSLNNLVELCIELGRLDEAETLARRALRLSTVVRSDLQAAFARELHGRVLLARGDPAGAAAELRAALAVSDRLGLPRVEEIKATLAEIDSGIDEDEDERLADD